MRFYKPKTNEFDAMLWLQQHNLFPLVIGIISVVSAFLTMETKLALQQQRVSYLETNLNQESTRVSTLSDQLTKQQLQLEQLTITQAVKGASTKSVPTLTPKGLSK